MSNQSSLLSLLIYLMSAALFLPSLFGCTTKIAETPKQDTVLQSETDAEKTATEAQDALTRSIYRVRDPGPFKLVTVKSLDPNSKTTDECWQARGEAGKFGGTLTVSIFGRDPKTYNYWDHQDAESAGLGLLMFDRLVEIDPWTGKMNPRMAKSVTVEKDKKTFTVKLRRGLKWSDGHALNADDVEFTFATIIKRGFGNSSMRDTLTVYGQFPEVKKIDDLTIQFVTPRPFAPFVSMLTNAPIAPKHVLEPITKRPMEEFHAFWSINCDPKTLVVSGPFKVGRYVPGQRIELERNANYSMVDKNGARLPYLSKFVIAVVPDQNTQILKFYGKELDFLDIRTVRGFDAALMKQRESTGDFTMFNLGPNDGTQFLMFNMNRRKDPKTNKYYVKPIKQEWFNDRNFRLAVSHAISRKRLVDNILRGVGLPLYTAESPASLYFNKALKPYPQDLNYSRALLQKSGFVLKDDVLYDRNGNRVEFSLTTNAGNSGRDATCIMIVNDLKQLGMKVYYQPIDFNIMIDKTAHSCDWEAIMMALTGDKVEPYNGANIWKADGRLHMFDQRLPDKNGTVRAPDARDWEKEIEECFNKAGTTFDEKLRHRYFDRYQEIVYEQQPLIYLYCLLDISAANNRIGNYRPTPLGITYTPRGSFHNIEEIYIKKAVQN
jgi:peptide/nickel transport system substrate-binding protein